MSAPRSVRDLFRRGMLVSPEFKTGLVFTLSLAVIAAAGRAAMPFITQRVVDDAVLAEGGANVAVAARYAAFGASVLVVGAFLAWWVRSRMVTSAEAGLATLRIRAFEKVHQLSVLTQNAEQRGRYVSHVTGDVETMRELMQWTGAAMVVSALEMVIVYVVMSAYSWRLALVVLVAYVPLIIALVVLQPKVTLAFHRVRALSADLLARTSEHIVGVATIRSYGVQERMRGRLGNDIDRIWAAERRASTLAASTFSTSVLGQALATGLALIVGTILATHGGISVGTVVAFAFLVYMFSGPLMWIIETLSELQRAMVGWRRVLDLVDAEVTVTDPGDVGKPLVRGHGEIVVDDVRLTYPEGPEVLKGVSFTVPAGKRLALVGQTGSGKTTLARLMSRFFDPTSGRILVGGVDLTGVPMSSLRRRIAVVPQEGFLFNGTIRSNLAYAIPEASDGELELQANAAFESLGLESWLGGFAGGLDTEVGPRGELLSAGERQLVSIARAYLRDPDVLILDEATSAVDPATEVRISRALEALMAGRTAIVIAHRLSTAERADLVGVMDHGALVEWGTHAELVAGQGLYADMFAAWVSQTRD